MAELAVRVAGLGKKYRITAQTARYKTLRESLARNVREPLRRLRNLACGRASDSADETLWALRDVSFDVERGEVLGVIGHNGSGKSTLLKILSRITEPTEGYAEVYGRVGSLLEVGTGFHYELSGRENVYLNGAMLGMRRAEIDRKFDEIVDFSQIGRFLDMPVKRYSSGMYLRLAFAVAAHLDTDVLVLDEVLAVGDHEFQKRCMAKMREVTRSGRTVFFVSHGLDSVRTLCDRALLLAHGRVVAQGDTSEVIRRYVENDALNASGANPPDGGPVPRIAIQSIDVLASDGQPSTDLDLGEPVTVRIVFRNECPGARYLVQIRLKDQFGHWVLSSHNEREATNAGEFSLERPHPAGLFEATCRIPANTLNDLTYSLTVVVGQWNGRNVDCAREIEHAATFTMHDGSRPDRGHSRFFLGPVRPRVSWQTELKEAA